MNLPILDCIVIGGGPAGLMAAVYLRRFKRSVQVLDEGKSRLALIPRTRNVLGFPKGIVGDDLLQRLRAHATKYGAPMHGARVEHLEKQGDTFAASTGAARFRARFVILATGANDVEPEVGGLAEAVKAGGVRY